MKSCHFLPALLLLGACARNPSPLEVRQYVLRDQEARNAEEPMVRMEKERRLRGAVSMEERRGRLGQYYTMLWNDQAGAGSAPVEVLFEFQQGGSASKIKRRTMGFPASDKSGKAEFSVIGDDYFKGGRVLAWKATLSRGPKVLATRQSYLWR